MIKYSRKYKKHILDYIPLETDVQIKSRKTDLKLTMGLWSNPPKAWLMFYQCMVKELAAPCETFLPVLGLEFGRKFLFLNMHQELKMTPNSLDLDMHLLLIT